MTIRKVVAGSVLIAGVATAGIFGAGTASAGPGISYDPGTDGTKTIGIGDTQSATGATTRASKGNRALAISLFRPSAANVNGGSKNNAIALDGTSLVGEGQTGAPEHNNVFTAYGYTLVGGPAKRNTFVNFGGRTISVDGPAENQTSVQVCGKLLSAQSTFITVSKRPASDGGIC